MKTQIVLFNNPSIITADLVNEDFYYGIEEGTSVYSNKPSTIESRGFITREHFRRGNFMAMCLASLTIGNGWSGTRCVNGESLYETVKCLLSYGYKVYQFNTSAELVEWLLTGK